MLPEPRARIGIAGTQRAQQLLRLLLLLIERWIRRQVATDVGHDSLLR
jgi:hypothetical protein